MKKSLTCIDCRVVFAYEHLRGPTRQRCDECRDKRKAVTDREKAKRYRERDPQRARDQWNKHNRKRLADPEHLRWKREDALRRSYGITQAEFNELLIQQGGVCAICKGERSGPGKVFHVDHDHLTQRVRGLLCHRCNTAIGLLNDDPERAEGVAAYLRK